MADEIEQTLHVAREVSVYRIPPRRGADGYRSGEWKVGDKIFSGRLRILARGELCEIRIEDPSSGELYAVCPVTYGKRTTCVEPVSDSSRYFVLRVEDPVTKRHAFLGMGFDDRADAFDFNESMLRHEKHVQRERAARQLEAGATSPSSSSAGGAGAAPVDDALFKEMQALHSNLGDLSIKDGQTIRVNLAKKPSSSSVAGGSRAAVPLMPLAPPPGFKPGTLAPPILPPPPAPAGTVSPPVWPAAAASASSSTVGALAASAIPTAAPAAATAGVSSIDFFADFSVAPKPPAKPAPAAAPASPIDLLGDWAPPVAPLATTAQQAAGQTLPTPAQEWTPFD